MLVGPIETYHQEKNAEGFWVDVEPRVNVAPHFHICFRTKARTRWSALRKVLGDLFSIEPVKTDMISCRDYCLKGKQALFAFGEPISP